MHAQLRSKISLKVYNIIVINLAIGNPYCTLAGPLQTVTNFDIEIINLNIFHLSWDAPFSLDLTNVEPDVIYCIQVINSTCGNVSILFSNCTVRETELNLLGYSQHHVYEIIITPRSNVEGTKNGTMLTTEGLS